MSSYIWQYGLNYFYSLFIYLRHLKYVTLICVLGAPAFISLSHTHTFTQTHIFFNFFLD